MELKVLLLLWLIFAPVQSALRTYFSYFPHARTWKKAQQFCRSIYGGDLVTALSGTDLSGLELTMFQAWIGLQKVNSSWQWIDSIYSTSRRKRFTLTGSLFAFEELRDNHDCGKVIYSNLTVRSDECHSKLFIFCKDLENYYFIPETKTWAEGLDYCRSIGWKYLSLHDILFGNELFWIPQDFPVWIGLHHNGAEWSWIDGTQSQYRNWTAGSPPEVATLDSCVAISSQDKSMFVRNCSEAFPFLCYKHSVVLVPELLSWEQALQRCKTIAPSNSSTSLRLLNLEESDMVYAPGFSNRANTRKVWVGLRFLGGSWLWTDGVHLPLPSVPSCPDSKLHCGALVASRNSVEPNDCSQKLNLLCYQEED